MNAVVGRVCIFHYCGFTIVIPEQAVADYDERHNEPVASIPIKDYGIAEMGSVFIDIPEEPKMPRPRNQSRPKDVKRNMKHLLYKKQQR